MTDRPQPEAGLKRPVSAPKTPLPPGSWDCHAHVFGPFDRFPVIPERRYEPPLSPAEDYLEMLDTVGFTDAVVVHASAKGHNMANVADTVARRPDRLIGVAVPAPDATDADYRKLHDQGFRGIRLTETGHPERAPGTLYFEDLPAIVPRLKALGWHLQIWGRCDRIVANAKMLTSLGVPVVFDHLGFPDAAEGADGPAFRAFLDWLPTGDLYVKATAVRVSKIAPDYKEARPFYEALLRAVPDRIVFGSDWPYMSLDRDLPNVGRMVDLFDTWTGDETLRRKLFVDNPLSLYRR